MRVFHPFKIKKGSEANRLVSRKPPNEWNKIHVGIPRLNESLYTSVNEFDNEARTPWHAGKGVTARRDFEKLYIGGNGRRQVGHSILISIHRWRQPAWKK